MCKLSANSYKSIYSHLEIRTHDFLWRSLCKNWYANMSVCHMLALQGFYGSFYSQISHLSPNSFGILFKRTRGVCPMFPRMLGRMPGALVLWQMRKYPQNYQHQLSLSTLHSHLYMMRAWWKHAHDVSNLVKCQQSVTMHTEQSIAHWTAFILSICQLTN